jgi:hypothetical protein
MIDPERTMEKPMPVLSPPLAERESPVADAGDAPSRITAPMFTPWACGLDEASEASSERCSDLMPELMVELL